MRRTIETRLSRLEDALGTKKGGVAFVNVPRGQTLEQALAHQGIREEDYHGLFVMMGRLDDATR